jgi:DNA polymerase-3 subunit delta'
MSLDGSLKVIVAVLDGASTEALNALLKVLEEPPPSVRFILVSAGQSLATVASRARVFRCGLLTTAQVRAALISRGADPEAAARQAPAGRGRVRPAMESAVFARSAGAVAAALRAVAARDQEALDGVVRGWELQEYLLLRTWASEAASGRWGLFSADASHGLGKAAGRRLLGALGRAGSASPRLAARAALAELMD